MSVTLDANILLYASDERSQLNEPARRLLERIAHGPEIVYLFWPTVMAYLRIATHPAVFARPLLHTEAIANVEALLDLPHIESPGEQERFWPRFREVSADVAPTGNLVADAHLVALMLENGVRTIWTRDRDYRKFKGITIHDPFEP